MGLKTYRIRTGVIALLVIVGAGCCSRTRALQEEENKGVVLRAADVLFADDFVDSNLDDWTVTSGTWRSGRGVLTLWGRGSGHDTKSDIKIITLSDLPPQNCRVEVDLRFLSEPREEAFAGILFRYQDPFNFYWYRFCDFETYQDRFEICEFHKGQRNIGQGSRQITFNPNQWRRLAVEMEDSNLRAYLDGEPVIDLVNPDLETGTVGLAVKRTAKVEFRHFRVYAP